MSKTEPTEKTPIMDRSKQTNEMKLDLLNTSSIVNDDFYPHNPFNEKHDALFWETVCILFLSYISIAEPS